MFACHRRLLLAGLLFLWIDLPLRGDPPQAKEPARTDLFGEPLPPGVKARLGTGRFRMQSRILGAALSADGKVVAVVEGGQVRLLDVASGKQRPGPRFSTESLAEPGPVALSPDGRLLATGEMSGSSVNVWKVSNGELLHFLKAHRNLSGLVFSANSAALTVSWARSHWQGPLPVWDMASGRELGTFIVKQTGRVQAALSPDGKSLLTWGDHQALQLWDVRSGKQHGPRLYADGVHAATFSPDGKVVAFAAKDGVFFWDLAKNDKPHSFIRDDEPVHTLAFTPDGKILVCARENHVLHLWEAMSGRSFAPDGGHSQEPGAIAFAPNGRTVLTAAGTRLIFWDADTGKQRERKKVSKQTFWWDHADGVGGPPFAFSPGGKYLAVNEGEDLILQDVATGKEVRRLQVQRMQNPRVAFSADGAVVAIAGEGDRGPQVWDVEAGEELLLAHRGLPGQLHGLAVSPDGKYVAVRGGPAVVLRVWDVANRRVDWEVEEPEGKSAAIAWSPDGKFLATGSHLWDVSTSQKVHAWRDAERSDRSLVAFSPDGRMLALSVPARDKTAEHVQVLEVITGEVRRELAGFAGTVTALAWSPDSAVLATGLSDTTTLLWDIRRPPAGPAPKERLSAKEVEKLWDALAKLPAEEAYRAIRKLAAAPRDVVPFLRERLRPVQPANPRYLGQLLAVLHGDDEEEREGARQELAALGHTAERALRGALKKDPPKDVRRVVKDLLRQLSPSARLPGLVRPLRALEVLELIGDEASRRLLAALAEGCPEDELTQEAGAILRRRAAR